MITLELNYDRAGALPNSREWYTAIVGKLGAIHVHNNTPDGKWQYRLTTIRTLDSRQTYDSKETAYNAALDSFTGQVAQALNDLTSAERIYVLVGEVTK